MNARTQFVVLVGLAGLALFVVAVLDRGIGALAPLAACVATAAGLEVLGPRLASGCRVSGSYLAILCAGVVSGPGAAAIVALAVVAIAAGRRRDASRAWFNFGSLTTSAVAAGYALGAASSREPGMALLGLAVAGVALNQVIGGLLVGAVVSLDSGKRAGLAVLQGVTELAPTYMTTGVAAVLMAALATSNLAVFVPLLVSSTLVAQHSLRLVTLAIAEQLRSAVQIPEGTVQRAA